MPRGLILATAVAVAFVPAGVAVAKHPIPGIRSPSGNIRCLFVPGPPSNLLCDIHTARYTKQLQDQCMARASLDWHGFTLTATRKGTPVCSGGILYNSNRDRPVYVTLPYGKTWRHGVFTCRSRTTGITCENRTGHGLFLSRESWRGW